MTAGIGIDRGRHPANPKATDTGTLAWDFATRLDWATATTKVRGKALAPPMDAEVAAEAAVERSDCWENPTELNADADEIILKC